MELELQLQVEFQLKMQRGEGEGNCDWDREEEGDGDGLGRQTNAAPLAVCHRYALFVVHVVVVVDVVCFCCCCYCCCVYLTQFTRFVFNALLMKPSCHITSKIAATAGSTSSCEGDTRTHAHTETITAQ